MKTAIAIAATLAAALAQAQDAAISPDQPGLVDSSQVVGIGRFQLEAAWAGERDHGQRATSTPLLLRAGLGDTLELRLQTDGRIKDGNTSGWADTSLGVKWHVLDEAGGLPSLAFIAGADVATGSAAFRGSGVRPNARVTAEWNLPGDFSAGMVAGVARQMDDAGGKFTGWLLGVTGGYGVSDRLRIFAELAGARLASAAHGGNDVSVGFGATWQLSNDWQLDAACNRGLSRASAHGAVTLGVSARF